jgi:hypothetical protein
VAGFVHTGEVVISPPDLRARRRAVDVDAPESPRPTPLEWARRRRDQRVVRRYSADVERVLQRLARLGPEWEYIEAGTIGLDSEQAFVAIGPGGVFAVTVYSQGRSRVMVSGDVVQINGRRPDLLGAAKRLATRVSDALSRTAGVRVPVVPVLCLAGAGLLSLYGRPRGCVVMPYRELDNLMRAYGDRLSPVTVDKLASVARHPSTAIDLHTDRLLSADPGAARRSSR